METEIIRLNLLSSVNYVRQTEAKPFSSPNETGNTGEKLYCFELEDDVRSVFEPDRRKFPGFLVFGAANSDAEAGEIPSPKVTNLPSGNYLFAQKREILGQERIIDMAVEIQQEGLWQRLKLGRKYYLRYLYEDNSWVTQLFRPYTEE